MPFDALFLTAVRRELESSLTGCRVDIDESRTEQKREGPDGKEVCYNPPRYEYSLSLIHI